MSYIYHAIFDVTTSKYVTCQTIYTLETGKKGKTGKLQSFAAHCFVNVWKVKVLPKRKNARNWTNPWTPCSMVFANLFAVVFKMSTKIKILVNMFGHHTLPPSLQPQLANNTNSALQFATTPLSTDVPTRTSGAKSFPTSSAMLQPMKFACTICIKTCIMMHKLFVVGGEASVLQWSDGSIKCNEFVKYLTK